MAVNDNLAEVEKTIQSPELKELFISIIEQYKAGSPTDNNVFWISLRPCYIAKLYEEQHHIKVTSGVIKL